jgi:hypothetical protein
MKTYPLLCRKLLSRYTQVFRNPFEVRLLLGVLIWPCFLSLKLCRCNNHTEITSPPYEVSETGWGEFEASLRVYFKDPNEAPLDLFHLIKLYPSGPPQPAGALKKVSIFIRFWEILLVFTMPPLFKANPGGHRRAVRGNSLLRSQ